MFFSFLYIRIRNFTWSLLDIDPYNSLSGLFASPKIATTTITTTTTQQHLQTHTHTQCSRMHSISEFRRDRHSTGAYASIQSNLSANCLFSIALCFLIFPPFWIPILLVWLRIRWVYHCCCRLWCCSLPIKLMMMHIIHEDFPI